MFNPNKTIGEQRCTPPGERLGVKLEIDVDRNLKLAPDSGQPSSEFELEVMLKGGHRNRVTQPVSSWDYTVMLYIHNLQYSVGERQLHLPGPIACGI